MSRIGSRFRLASASIERHIPALRDQDLVWGTVLLGVVSGLAEASAISIRYWVLHQPVGGWVAGELYWLTPLAACATLFVITAAVILVQRTTRRFGPINGVTLFVLSTLCAFSFGRAVRSGINNYALLLLAAGLAAQFLRVGLRFPAGFARWIRRGAVLGGSAVCVWALTQPYRNESHMQSPPTQEFHAAEPGRPNVIIVAWDTVRARSLSLYGYERKTTPHLDQFASRSAVFDAAVTPAPWTLPAHVGLLTGLYHHEHSADRESPLGPGPLTLAERLARRGYQTAGFVANDYWLGRGFGLDRGFERYEDQEPVSVGGVISSWWLSRKLQPWIKRYVVNYRSSSRITAQLINQRFLNWLDQRNSRPFFAFLNLFDAHDPYLPPDGFGFKFSPKTPRFSWDYTRQTRFSSTDLQEMRDAYDSCIYYLDEQFGTLIKQLEQRGLLENTLVILTSDHGETLGEHEPDLIGHETSEYYDVLNVPLVVYFPSRVQAGLRHAPVNLADIPISVMDIVTAGEETNSFPGQSIVPAAQASERAADEPRMLLSQGNPASWHKGLAWPMSKGPLYSLVAGTMHYIVNSENTEQLFDLSSDPWERKDLSQTAPGTAVLPRFRDELRRRGVGAANSGIVAMKKD